MSLAISGMLLVNSDASIAQNAWRKIPANAIFETGDTWISGGKQFRLYGVQACIRGTYITGKDAKKRDCGELSLGMLTGLVKAWDPLCAVVSEAASTSYVICYADVENGSLRERVELGTALIASGFAFAAQNNLGGPASISYWAAEQQAKATKSGLWQYLDLPNPNDVLLKALNGTR